MRTPNSICIICSKPLYRRKFELAKIRYVACMEHRYVAQRMYGQTESQKMALMLGRPKGTNHLGGIPKSEESNRKRSESHKKWCKENPDKVAARGAKCRGEKHYNWGGGISRLNVSIRTMTENRRWMDAVRDRDGWCCQKCKSCDLPEAHHIIPLSELLLRFNIKNHADARKHASVLWDLNNGETLCQRCHYEKHGRLYFADQRITISATA